MAARLGNGALKTLCKCRWLERDTPLASRVSAVAFDEKGMSKDMAISVIMPMNFLLEIGPRGPDCIGRVRHFHSRDRRFASARRNGKR